MPHLFENVKTISEKLPFFFDNFFFKGYISTKMKLEIPNEYEGSCMTIKEIAQIAGVSIASVSRAFQTPPSPYISEKQRERILKICEEMHYYPNINSRRMTQKFTNTVVLMSHDLPTVPQPNCQYFQYDYNFGLITQGIQSVLSRNGKGLQLVWVNAEYLAAHKHIELARSKIADGILVWGALDNDDFVRELGGEKIPVIQLTSVIRGTRTLNVVADEYGGMAEIARKVIEAGHEKIAILRPSLRASSGMLRCKAVLDTLSRNGLNPYWTSEKDSYGYEFGAEGAMEILKKAPGTTCIIAPNDLTAWGCIDVLSANGVRVPEDISVTGADGIRFPSTLKLESFYMPSFEIGAAGALALCSMLNGESGETQQSIPVTMIPGNSLKRL